MSPFLTTKLNSFRVVETTIGGRVTGEVIEQMVLGYKKNDLGLGFWFIRAEAATSYGADAIQKAVNLFGDLHRSNGLVKIFAVLKVPTVRMGASVVSMGLRAGGSPLEIKVFENVEEAKAVLQELLEAKRRNPK